MRRFVVLLPIAFILVSCDPESDDTGTAAINKCATGLHPSYDPKQRDQCVDVCIKCAHGNMVTCSTSCFMRGAH